MLGTHKGVPLQDTLTFYFSPFTFHFFHLAWYSWHSRPCGRSNPTNEVFFMSFSQFSNQLSHRLLVWSWLSVGSGTAMATAADETMRGVGQQFWGWGAIDALIALFGLWQNQRRGPLTADQETAELTKLRRILWVNTFLDVGYVVGGWWLARTKGRTAPRWRGTGWGIVIQGGFLFLFDLWHVGRSYTV